MCRRSWEEERYGSGSARNERGRRNEWRGGKASEKVRNDERRGRNEWEKCWT